MGTYRAPFWGFFVLDEKLLFQNEKSAVRRTHDGGVRENTQGRGSVKVLKKGGL